MRRPSYAIALALGATLARGGPIVIQGPVHHDPLSPGKAPRTDTFTARRKAEKAKARIRKGKNPWR